MPDEATNDRAREAAAQLESIHELVRAYDDARLQGRDEREALTAIQEDPLSIQVRSTWEQPGGSRDPAEYRILLSWGGPASRIVGELANGEPMTASLEYQDWFMPWEPLHLSNADAEALLEYARCFYFGD